jgi:lipopolysaccharide biosynthesis glycosyltransferase
MIVQLPSKSKPLRFFVGNEAEYAYNRAASMINLCYCGNAKIAQGLLLSLLSVRETTSEPLKVYLLTADLTSLSKDNRPINERLRAYLESLLQEKNPESEVFLFDETERFYPLFKDSPNLATPYTPYSMLRLILDLEPRLPANLLYLDTDAVALKDIAPLYRTNLGDCDRAMGLDAVFSRLFDPHYCNSGVILFDLDKVRKDGLLQEGRTLLNQKKFVMPDQEAFNRIQKEKILILPRIYNEQRSIAPDTVIRHYCQQVHFFYVKKEKPWDGARFQKAYPDDHLDGLMKLFEEKEKGL